MTSFGLVFGFFGDAEAAAQARRTLYASGYRQLAVLTKGVGGKVAVSRPGTRAGVATLAGAGTGAWTGSRLAPRGSSREWGEAATAVGAGVGGALGYLLGTALETSLPEGLLEGFKPSLMQGETLVVVRAPARYLSDALRLLREGENGPATFVERPALVRAATEKAPLRRELPSPERMLAEASALAGAHTQVREGGGEWLLHRLAQNTALISAVVRGLAEATRLDQPVALSAEWLLDNNYIIQGQIADVQRNLTPKFLRRLPTLTTGRYTSVPRAYLLASELVAALDSRLDRQHIVEFVAMYQSVTPLTTGELWALPLMLRLALLENLRRITAHLDRRQRERERADFWANRLLAAAVREPDQILPLLADLSKEQRQIAPHFAERLVSHLFDEEAALGPVRAWLERKTDAPLGEILGREQRRQASDSVSVANVITSLRMLSNLDWRECFEQLSLVDQILSQDPAGVYRSMDFASRDRYRSQVERISRGAQRSELEVARSCIASAAEASQGPLQHAGPGQGEREHEALIYQPAGHVGFYLIDEGQQGFEAQLGYRGTSWSRLRGWFRDHPKELYFGSAGAGTLLALWGLRRLASGFGGSLPVRLAILAVVSSSEVALQAVNYAVTRLVPPRPLPKMEFRDGLPERWKTVVAVPMLLGSVAEAREGAHQLELHHLSNADPHLRFALLADYVDAPEKHLPSDAERAEAARSAIEELNARYGEERFFLFLRERAWSESEDRWMGRERKRGKIEEFNAYLQGRRRDVATVLHPEAGEPAALDGVRFVITLDADTQLPYGAAGRLIETLAHPLNRPVLEPDPLDGDHPRLARGYTLIQPRVDTALPSATATRFSRLFTDASGSDPYTHVVSDVYQDVFAEGSYHGKGIYDLEAFDAILHDRFPPATLLSHDLLEGSFVRVGLASDIQLLDRFPPHYPGYAKRDHRWIRGDWQIAEWVLPRVKTAAGWRANPISLLNRWKIADNLRRSLLAPAAVGMLAAGWLGGAATAYTASLAVAGLLLWPVGIALFTRATTRPETLPAGGNEVARGLLRAAVDASLLLSRAELALDAIARVAYRRLVSRKLLLEWQPAASTYGGEAAQETAFLLHLSLGAAAAGVALLAFAAYSPLCLVAAAPYLVAWAAAPAVVRWLAGGAYRRECEPLAAADVTLLREVARQTWRYYDDFVGPQTHWLPPDNYQESLNVEIAQRTSPTNMGLWLLACAAACDFGWLPFDDVVARTRASLATLEGLERHEGHLLNWYDSLSLEPLRPRYVSTVDSGNLLGSLWTLERSVHELEQQPFIGDQARLGLRDVLGLLETALGKDAREFEAELAPVRRLLGEEPHEALDVMRMVRQLDAPAAALSRALSQRPLPGKASERSRAELHRATTDPRFVISAPSYWAAQLAGQLALWDQVCNRYGRWMETLAAPGDAFVNLLGDDAASVRREALALAPSIADLAAGRVSGLEPLLARGAEAQHSNDLRDWLNRVREEFGRARWLAGEMLGQADGVGASARRLADGTQLGFLYDASRKLFSIGYNVEERRLDSSYYDLLASECRLASFCAVARGDVPAEHWLALGRRFGQTPAGPALMSWSGTMFEYLMPLLFQRAFENSLLDRAEKLAVAAQIAYGRQRGVPWGISEAAFSALDANRTYQYKAFGVPSLGLKRGLEDDLVVAPYATLMALMVDPQEALQNLKRLEAMGARGDYGFYESIDFRRERLEEDSLVALREGETAVAGGRKSSEAQRGAIVRCYMVHHQGMALLALQNVLLDWGVQKRFHSDVLVEAAEPLLYEKIPESPPILQLAAPEDSRPTRTDMGGASEEGRLSPDTPAPRAHLLGSERYGVVVTAAGGGYSRWRDLELTRWRSDTTRDSWGQFLYLRDLDSNAAWSAAHQPMRRPARRAGVLFRAEKAEFERRENDVESRVEVCVSPEDDVEVRRVTVINHSNRPRRLETTSFMELALAPHAADRSHPAFNKLFIQTSRVENRNALLAWRRLRSPGDQPVWAAHLLCASEAAESVQWETDRSQFLGRQRAADNPVALEGDLSGTVGAVLDPCFSWRRRFTLRPGQRVTFAYVTGAADSLAGITRLVEHYSDFSACERVFDLAWTHSQLELHHFRARADEAQSFQQLAGLMLYPHPSLRAPARRLRDNLKGQPGLWAYGISGDLPIMVVAIDNDRDVAVVRQALLAHTFWRVRGLKTDLVVLNEQAGGYNQELSDTLRKLIDASTPYTGTDQPGGVFLRATDTVPPEDINLLLSSARVVLVAARGSIAQQLGVVNDEAEPLAKAIVPVREAPEPELPLPFLSLPYFNGLGGFTPDGREYAIYLGPRDRTPAPWINVFAHANFGALVSESGSGYAWSGNSQSNRLTPWNNDPVSDPATEAVYVRDEDTGTMWTPTALPIRENEAYRARHGQGYTTFEHNSHGIESELTVFVPMDEALRPVRVQRLKLRNRSGRRRRLLVCYYGAWVLGTTREETQMHVVSAWDGPSSALLATNAWNASFAGKVAFASAVPAPQWHSADRTAFLGRNGSSSAPAALRRRMLTERTGAGLDPCAVLQVLVELAPGEESTVSFLLGECDNVEEVRSLVGELRDPGAVDRALESTRAWWDEMLGTVQVDVPDVAVNFLLNRWLPYQTLSCRIWGRSALYQSGGAWGFRDQLQDSLALTTLRPAVAREQILRCAAHQFEEGDVQHWWHPPGDAGVRTLISDDLLFLPYAVAQYVAVTGDASVLDEMVPFLHADVLGPDEHEKYFEPAVSGQSATVYEHCLRALRKGATAGAHGLPLFGSGDWNDGLNRVGIGGKGESVWLAWFLVEVLNRFAPLCQARGEAEVAQGFREQASAYVRQIDAQAWDGAWYRRGYFDDGTPLGSVGQMEARIDSLPQSWSVIAGGGDADRSRLAMQAVASQLIRPDDKLILLFTPAFDHSPHDPGYIKGYLPGVRENGGQYTHAACWVAYAYALAGEGGRAVDALRLLNPVEHARDPASVARYKVEPYAVAADVYALENQLGRGGWTWYTGSCGWMYRVWMEAVLGFNKRGEFLEMNPSIPADWKRFHLAYRHGAACYEIEVENPDGVEHGVAWVELDGERCPDGRVALHDDGAVHQVRVRLGTVAAKV